MDKRLVNYTNYFLNKNKIEKDFLEYLKDSSVPLEERWGNFCKYSYNLNYEQTSCEGYGPIELCQMYNPPDRYRTYMYESDIEYLENTLYLEEGYHPSSYTFEGCTKALEDIGIKYEKGIDINKWNVQIKEFIDSLKEDILKNGFSGYVYDW